MTEKVTETQRELLSRMSAYDGSASTHHIRHVGGSVIPGQQARRALHRLVAHGLVKPRKSSGGLTFWWQITPAGRHALENNAFEMTPEQKELARHALGLTRKRVSWRNHFVTGEGGPDHALWMEMVAAGQATRRAGNELTGGDDLFRLTRLGAAVALKHGERLDPEDFPAEGCAALEHEGGGHV